jgi:predicted nucleic acid-binding protein
MDFADATLVHLANRESLTAILTIDQADFATYRLAGKKRFHVLPIDQP